MSRHRRAILSVLWLAGYFLLRQGALCPLSAAPGSDQFSLNLTIRGITPVRDLTATQGTSTGTIVLNWTEPYYSDVTLPVSYVIKVSTAGQIENSQDFDAAQPLSTFSPTPVPDTGPGGGLIALSVEGLQFAATYYFAIREQDSGAPLMGAWARNISKGWNLNNFAKPFFPPAPIADLGAMPGLEGQALLSWTAPGEDNVPFPSGDPVASYIMRYATFSAQSAGSTTTWWNAAQDATGEPWPPLDPGEAQSMLFNDLDPGVTFYFAIKSQYDAGNTSAIDTRTESLVNQSSACVYDAAPSAPSGLAASTVSLTDIQLEWNAVTASDIDFYRIYADSTPPYNFADSYIITVDSDTISYTHSGLDRFSTYYYCVTAVDKGAPDFPGHALESPPSNTAGAVFEIYIDILPPAPPARLKRIINGDGKTIKLLWSPVTTNEDGSSFADPASPTAEELLEYNIYRTTSVWLNEYELISLSSLATSTDTLDVSDINGNNYFYQLTATDTYKESAPSLWIEAFSGDLLLASLDTPQCLLRIHNSLTPDLDENTNALGYDVRVSMERYPEEIGGKVVQSIGYTPRNAQTGQPAPVFAFPEPKLEITFFYQGADGIRGLANLAPGDAGIYWHNGSTWVKLYGKVDALNQSIRVTTSMLGRYQLRNLLRNAGFAFNPSEISNRLLTPNNDGRNDVVIFPYEGSSPVSGKIFDLKGAFVAEMTQGPWGGSLKWDGKANGRVVPSAVYVYQIEAEGKAFNGTIVVIR